MKKNIQIIIIIFFTFIFQKLYAIFIIHNFRIKTLLTDLLSKNIISYIIYLIISFIPFIVSFILLEKFHKRNEVYKKNNYKNNLVFILLSVLPLILYGIIDGEFVLFSLRSDVLADIVNPIFLILTFIWFLFFQLYDRTNLGFLSVVIISLLIYILTDLMFFKNILLWNNQQIIKSIGTLIIIAWIFIEMGKDISVPIFLLIGLTFIPYTFLYSQSTDELKPIFVFTTIWFIILTVIYKTLKKEKFEISLKSLFTKN